MRFGSKGQDPERSLGISGHEYAVEVDRCEWSDWMNTASWRIEVRRLGMLRVDLRRRERVLYIDGFEEVDGRWCCRSASVVGKAEEFGGCGSISPFSVSSFMLVMACLSHICSVMF